MKVKFLQSYISKLNGVSFYYEDKKEIMFLSTANNIEKYWRIKYVKGKYEDRGYSISGETLYEYENLLTYSELKDYIKRILETNNMK